MKWKLNESSSYSYIRIEDLALLYIVLLALTVYMCFTKIVPGEVLYEAG